MVTVLLIFPEVPVTTTEYVPGTVAAPVLKVKELVLVVAVELKTAVAPLGSPETVNETLLANPFSPAMLIVLALLVPPTLSVRVAAEVERLKLGCGTVSLIVAALETESAVPVTVTV